MPGLDPLLGLTTVRIPVETVARRGTELLSELIAAEEPLSVRHEAYAGTLVAGRTLGPPAG
jgi:DNA-binding LacI/PurR family transcriptional regulator